MDPNYDVSSQDVNRQADRYRKYDLGKLSGKFRKLDISENNPGEEKIDQAKMIKLGRSVSSWTRHEFFSRIGHKLVLSFSTFLNLLPFIPKSPKLEGQKTKAESYFLGHAVAAIRSLETDQVEKIKVIDGKEIQPELVTLAVKNILIASKHENAVLGYQLLGDVAKQIPKDTFDRFMFLVDLKDPQSALSKKYPAFRASDEVRTILGRLEGKSNEQIAAMLIREELTKKLIEGGVLKEEHRPQAYLSEEEKKLLDQLPARKSEFRDAKNKAREAIGLEIDGAPSIADKKGEILAEFETSCDAYESADNQTYSEYQAKITEITGQITAKIQEKISAKIEENKRAYNDKKAEVRGIIDALEEDPLIEPGHAAALETLAKTTYDGYEAREENNYEDYNQFIDDTKAKIEKKIFELKQISYKRREQTRSTVKEKFAHIVEEFDIPQNDLDEFAERLFKAKGVSQNDQQYSPSEVCAGYIQKLEEFIRDVRQEKSQTKDKILFFQVEKSKKEKAELNQNANQRMTDAFRLLIDNIQVYEEIVPPPEVENADRQEMNPPGPEADAMPAVVMGEGEPDPGVVAEGIGDAAERGKLEGDRLPFEPLDPRHLPKIVEEHLPAEVWPVDRQNEAAKQFIAEARPLVEGLLNAIGPKLKPREIQAALDEIFRFEAGQEGVAVGKIYGLMNKVLPMPISFSFLPKKATGMALGEVLADSEKRKLFKDAFAAVQGKKPKVEYRGGEWKVKAGQKLENEKQILQLLNEIPLARVLLSAERESQAGSLLEFYTMMTSKAVADKVSDLGLGLGLKLYGKIASTILEEKPKAQQVAYTPILTEAVKMFADTLKLGRTAREVLIKEFAPNNNKPDNKALCEAVLGVVVSAVVVMENNGLLDHYNKLKELQESHMALLAGLVPPEEDALGPVAGGDDF